LDPAFRESKITKNLVVASTTLLQGEKVHGLVKRDLATSTQFRRFKSPVDKNVQSGESVRVRVCTWLERLVLVRILYIIDTRLIPYKKKVPILEG
jgi:hypothetical protein